MNQEFSKQVSNDTDYIDYVQVINKGMPYFNGVQRYLNKINKIERIGQINRTFTFFSIMRVVVRMSLSSIITMPIYLLLGEPVGLYIGLIIMLTYGFFGSFINAIFLNASINKTKDELQQYMIENATPESDMIAPMYRYADAVNFIKECFINDKVDTIREAYFLYDDYIQKNAVQEQLAYLTKSMQLMTFK